ncbi:MAG: DUF6165 family protein [Phycisphaerae bacterium]|nr:DUF6165 family protein [Phycisphaerae bacterium]
MELRIPVSAGELIDKLTILEIKGERMSDAQKLKNVQLERKLLADIVTGEIPDSSELTRLQAEMKSVNETLWEIEDRVRDCERRKDFGAAFVEDARAVYITNDRRSQVKRQINALLGSEIVEEKSYEAY